MYDQGIEILTSSDSAVTGSSLSGTDAITLLEIIHSTISCATERDFKALFPRIQELFPFDFVIAVSGHHDEKRGVVQGPCVNVSFPDEWMREYTSRSYFRMDAILKENYSSYQVQFWPVGRKRLHRLKEITSLGLDFGLRECCTYGSRPTASEKNGSMFCFASNTIKQSNRTEAILKYLVPHLHVALSTVSGSVPSDDIPPAITTREKEVLDWLEKGKSSWDISVILDISERTVNFHVYNIMRKLGATNRPQAVALAARLGLISIS